MLPNYNESYVQIIYWSYIIAITHDAKLQINSNVNMNNI